MQKEDVTLHFAEQLQNRDSKKKGLTKYFKEASNYVNSYWDTLENKLSIVSGKQLVKQINEWMRNEYDKHCTQTKILTFIRADEIDDEMVKIIKMICL